MLIKFLPILLVVFTYSIAQLNIAGIVSDSITNLPLNGAIVTLNHSSLTDTTDTNGHFELHGNVTITKKLFSNKNASPAFIGNNNQLELQAIKTLQLRIFIINLQGQKIKTIHDDIINQGNYCFHAPILASGYYYYSINSSDGNYCLPFLITDNKNALNARISKPKQFNTKDIFSEPRQFGATEIFTDTIIVSKPGFYQCLVPVSSQIISSMEIKCRRYSDSVQDVDGNIYHTVKIGNQVWMVENLKTTKYNDSTPIPYITDDALWASLTSPGYCWYDNDSSKYKVTYGALYNWFTVNTGKLAPTGWHVPNDEEWNTLSNYLGGDTVASGKLRETGTMHWQSPNISATNETGFTAVPGGQRSSEISFRLFGSCGFWWSSDGNDNTLCISRSMRSFNNRIYPGAWSNKDGFSIRCIRNHN